MLETVGKEEREGGYRNLFFPILVLRAGVNVLPVLVVIGLSPMIFSQIFILESAGSLTFRPLVML